LLRILGERESGTARLEEVPFGSLVRLALLQILPDAFISGASSLEPGRICMIMSYSQSTFSRPKPMPDACVAL
jgi:hypothetical protein